MLTGPVAAALVCLLIGGGVALVTRLRYHRIVASGAETSAQMDKRFSDKMTRLIPVLFLYWGALIRMTGTNAGFLRYLAVGVAMGGLAVACFLPVIWLFKRRYGISPNDEESLQHVGMALYFVTLFGAALVLFFLAFLVADEIGFIDVGL